MLLRIQEDIAFCLSRFALFEGGPLGCRLNPTGKASVLDQSLSL
jgi:hypothetical protein